MVPYQPTACLAVHPCRSTKEYASVPVPLDSTRLSPSFASLVMGIARIVATVQPIARIAKTEPFLSRLAMAIDVRLAVARGLILIRLLLAACHATIVVSPAQDPLLASALVAAMLCCGRGSASPVVQLDTPWSI